MSNRKLNEMKWVSYQEFCIVSEVKGLLMYTFNHRFVEISSKQFDSIASVMYKAVNCNLYNLSPEGLVEVFDISQKFAEALAKGYKDYIFGRVSFLIHARTNMIPINPLKDSLTYSCVIVPTGPNSATFKPGDPAAREVRENLSKIFDL